MDEHLVSEVPSLSRAEVVLLSRYCAAKFVLKYVHLIAWMKYVVLAVALFVAVAPWDSILRWILAGALFTVFVEAVLVQRFVVRLARRLGRLDDLQELDQIVDVSLAEFQSELRRVTGATRWHRLLFVAIRLMHGRAAAVELFDRIYGMDWEKVVPTSRIGEARAALARVAR